MKSIFYSVAILLSLSNCNSDERNWKELLNEYNADGFYSGYRLQLDEKHTFEYEDREFNCFGSATVRFVSGNFDLRENYIILKPGAYKELYFSEWPIKGKKKLEETRIKDLNDLTWFHDSIAILKWRKKIYLLGANQSERTEPNRYLGQSLLDFINANNSGRNAFIGKDSLIAGIFTKPCNDCIEENLKKAVPSEWSDLVMSEEISCNVLRADTLKVNHGLVDSKVIINKGSDNGIKTGMVLHPLSASYISVEIVKVGKTSSEGICRFTPPNKFNIGEILSIRVEKN